MKRDFIDYNVAGMRDSLNVLMNSVNVIQREKMLSAKGMEATEAAKYALTLICRSLTMMDDVKGMAYCPGYYNIKDYLDSVCTGFQSVCRLFNTDIDVNVRPEDNENIVFDGEAMEKVFYNCIYILIANSSCEKCKLALSVKNSFNTVTFCVKSNAPFIGSATRKEMIDNLSIRHDSVQDSDKAYLDKVVELMRGSVNFCSGKKSAKFEICIPKDLKLEATIMKEAEAIFINNEYVMKYEANPRKNISMFMRPLLRSEEPCIAHNKIIS